MEKNQGEPFFYVSISGQIERAELSSQEDLYCRYSFHFGPDWTIISGIQTGLSQTARKSPFNNEEGIVWNFPIDLTFRSTNPFGWPRIAVNVYGIDALGRDVLAGVGSCLVPPLSGVFTLDMDTYVPLSSSILNDWLSWLLGNQPEFFDSKFVCQGEGRDVTRVRATGRVRLKINVLTKGMQAVGYSVADQTPYPQTAFTDIPPSTSS